jgi:hypothetical protein
MRSIAEWLERLTANAEAPEHPPTECMESEGRQMKQR